jgi:hypothetical protein
MNFPKFAVEQPVVVVGVAMIIAAFIIVLPTALYLRKRRQRLSNDSAIELR